MKILRFFLALFIFIPLSYSFVCQLILLSASFHLNQPQIWFWGFFASMFVIALLFIKQYSYIAILKHELTHNLFAVLTFYKPTGLHVTAGKGGEFHHEGKTNVLMLLAPYFFPLITSVIILISLFDIRANHLYLSVIGITMGFDLSTSIKDIHLKQKDLQQYNLFFSLCFVLLLILIFYGMSIAFAVNDFKSAGNYFIHGFIDVIPRITRFF